MFPILSVRPLLLYYTSHRQNAAMPPVRAGPRRAVCS